MVSFTDLVQSEYHRARMQHPKMNSLHEGLAVMWEEFEEVKQEVFKKNPDLEKVKAELVQVATMAMAMFHEVC